MRMMTRTRGTILSTLMQTRDEYVTIGDIQKKIDVSRKTVSLEIQKLDEFLAIADARIETVPSKGYRIIAQNSENYEVFREKFLRHEKRDRYMNHDKYYLTYMIIMKMMLKEDYVSIDELADIFHYSRGTISNNIPLIKKKLAVFGCTLQSKPGYGMRIQGSEWQKRILILFYSKIASSVVFMQADANGIGAEFKALTTNNRFGYYDLKPLVEKVQRKHGVIIPLVYQQLLTFYIYLSRIRRDKSIYLDFSAADLRRLKPTRFYAAAHELAVELYEYGFAPSENDILAMAVLMDAYATRRHPGELDEYQQSLCRGDAEMFVRRAAELYPGVERYLDQQFKDELMCWLAGMHERQFFGLPSDKEVTYAISREGLFNADLCCDFAVLYKELYRVELPQDELLQPYYIIGDSLRRNVAQNTRLRVAIASSYGIAYSRYNARMLMRRYGRSISLLKEFEVGELGSLDSSRFDVLVTDVHPNQTSGCELPLVTMDVMRSGHSLNFNEYLSRYNASLLETVIDKDSFRRHTALKSPGEVFDYLADSFSAGNAARLY